MRYTAVYSVSDSRFQTMKQIRVTSTFLVCLHFVSCTRITTNGFFDPHKGKLFITTSRSTVTTMSQNTKTYKDAFALFDKKGTGKIPVEHLGDLLRSVGQNPTLAEISELQKTVKGDEFDYDTYESIINRPDGFKPLGLPEDYIKGFQVFDKDQTGYIGVGELRYILTSIGEKLTDSEVDELLKGVNVTSDGNVDYVEFVKSILDQ